MITAADENTFEYCRVDKVTPDEVFGHYVHVTYFQLDESRNLVVTINPKTRNPWTDEVARDAIIKCLGVVSHVSLELEKEILELIQDVYAM